MTSIPFASRLAPLSLPAKSATTARTRSITAGKSTSGGAIVSP